ncbi:Kinetochore protein Nuf2-B [Amphibalanus amphitrite]|uniref:Kinetochore protein Nuf2-B n=1 Tax=Amphibalanus amphitrite TaxID=1232801 RepID=A0A6A4WY58_AMPAM|nr:Kinetochore protein Nuf2-B [Amphibalanus amphitrite]
MASGSSMSFPTLSEEELINLGKEMLGPESPITLAALRSPTTETTLMLFRVFLTDIFSWNLDVCTMVPFDAMARVHFFETHQDIAPVMRFFRVMSSLLSCVHYDSFIIEDLLQPNPKRLRRQLSALANFSLLHQRMCDEYADETIKKTDQEILYEERLVNENKALKSNIHREIEREDELKVELQQRHSAIDDRNQEISALHDQKEQLEREAKQTRAEVARLEDQKSEDAVQDAKLNEERTALEAQLVGSPEKVRQTLTRAQEQLRAVEKQRQSVSEQLQQSRGDRQQRQQAHEELQRREQHAEVVRELSERQRDKSGELTAVTKDMEAILLEETERRSAARLAVNKCQMIEESREGEMQKYERYIKDKQAELDKRERVQEEARARLAADQQETGQLAEQAELLEQRAQQEAEREQRRLQELQHREQQLADAVSHSPLCLSVCLSLCLYVVCLYLDS